jgi:hypothetical protein
VGKDAVCRRRDQGEGPPPDDGPHNDNAPFDPKAWRRKYMRKYMAERRKREKAANPPKD